MPKPVFLDQDELFLGQPSLTIEFIEGHTDFSPENLSGSIEQMAIQLAEIHNMDIQSAALSVHEKKTVIATNHEQELSEEELEVHEFLTGIWPLHSRNRPTLVHGDYWPGNLLWNANRLVAVIDWEAAGIADPLLDLATTRLDLLWLFGQEAMENFTGIYKNRAQPDMTGLPYWDLWASTRPNGFVRCVGKRLSWFRTTGYYRKLSERRACIFCPASFRENQEVSESPAIHPHRAFCICSMATHPSGVIPMISVTVPSV